MPGTYQTHGLTFCSGVKVLGSGIDVTILQFPYQTPNGSTMIESAYVGGYPQTNIVVSDLTCDLGYSPGYIYNGVILDGTQHTIRRVKLINQMRQSTFNSESWGLFIFNYKLPKSIGNIIEECEVSQFQDGSSSVNGISDGIGFCSGAANAGQPTGVILNNRVIAGSLTNCLVNAIFLANDSLIKGNYVEGAAFGSYCEGSISNVLYVNNTFKNCSLPIYTVNSGYAHLTFAYNQMVLSSNAWGAFDLGSGTNIAICGNKIELPVGGSALYCINGQNVTGLIVANNTVDSSLANTINNCVNVQFVNNYDLYGNYLWGSAPAHKWTAALPIKAAPEVSGLTVGSSPNPVMYDAARVTPSACGILYGVAPHGVGFSNITSTIDLEGDAGIPPTTVFAQLSTWSGNNWVSAPRQNAVVMPGQITSITFSNVTGWVNDTAGRQVRVGLFDQNYQNLGPTNNVWLVGWTVNSVE